VDGMLAGGALQHLRAAPRRAWSGWPTNTVPAGSTRRAPGRLDTACARAADVGDPGYRTIKGILVVGTETDINDAAR